jgi:hypothetical protein
MKMLLDWKYNPAIKSWRACSKIDNKLMWKINISSDGQFVIKYSDYTLLAMLKNYDLDDYAYSTLLEAQLACLSGDLMADRFCFSE